MRGLATRVMMLGMTNYFKKEKKPKYKKEQLRKELERNHGVWVRNDIWVALKKYAKANAPLSMKQIINEALYDYLIRHNLEAKTGMISPYKETTFDLERGTLRKDEADTYIKED